jgi:hypothetical protein
MDSLTLSLQQLQVLHLPSSQEQHPQPAIIKDLNRSGLRRKDSQE